MPIALPVPFEEGGPAATDAEGHEWEEGRRQPVVGRHPRAWLGVGVLSAMLNAPVAPRLQGD
ncbi:MAG: hypothetical protein WCB86_01690 [Candidatus Dormiibacterota bacterium]